MYHPRLRGSYYDMGYKYGDILYRNGFRLPALSKEKLDFGLESIKELRRFYPEVIEEIKGFAEACKVTSEEVASFILSIGVFDLNAQCSIFAIKNKSDVIIGRNYDMNLDIKKYTESSLICPDNSFAYIGHSDVFLGKVDGINEKGLGIGITYVDGGGKRAGVNFYFVVRYILEKCSKVDEAISALQDIQVSMSTNYLIADSGGNMVVVETSPQRVEVRKPSESENFIICTNHFNHPKMIQYENKSNRGWSKSEIRYNTIYKAISQNKNFSIRNAIEILSDNSGCVCMNLKKHNFGTLFSVIYSLRDLKALRAEGQPNKAYHREDKRLINEYRKRK